MNDPQSPDDADEPAVEPRSADLSPPPRHPAVDYDALDALPQTERVLDAVFTINRHAKRLDEEARSAYRRGDGATARALSIRKKALYRTKTIAVHRLVKSNPDAVRLERHELADDHEMLCVYFDDHSFHQPIPAVERGLVADASDVDDRSELEPIPIDFTASSDTDSLSLSLETALGILADRGLDANDYLDADRVTDFTWGYEIETTFSLRSP